MALVGVALYFRPGQVDPRAIPTGASRVWVYWNCGAPGDDFDEETWNYRALGTRDFVFVRYDGDGRVKGTEVLSMSELARELSK